MFLGKFFDAPVKAIIVPAKGKQHAGLRLSHRQPSSLALPWPTDAAVFSRLAERQTLIHLFAFGTICCGPCFSKHDWNAVHPARRSVFHPIPSFQRNRNAVAMRKTGNGHHLDLEQFLNDIKTIVKDGEDLLKAGVSDVKQRALTGAQTTDRAVREHPYTTLGIVFGLGVLVGVLAIGLFTGEEEEDDQI